MKRSVILLAVLALTGCKKSVQAPKPLEQLSAQEQAGHAVFNARCAVCHNDRENAAKNGPPLTGVFQKQYLPSGAPANDDRVTNTIMHGRVNMPAFGDSISPEETQALLAYLHTL